MVERRLTMANKVKELLRQGDVSYGIWLEWKDPDVLETCGYLGFDYVMIEAEHAPLDRSTATELMRAADLVGMVPIVRVPSKDPAVILGYLEIGAKGIYVPHVNTADDARQIVRAVKFPPDGQRGGGAWRAVQYGLTESPPDYLRRANEETMVIALVEEVEGVQNLDAILNVDGVDVVGIGDGDLSLSMGFIGERAHPDVRRVVDDAETRIAASSKVLDAVVTDTADARAAVERGCRMISLKISLSLVGMLRDYLGTLRPAPK
jgi:4-hydroxy-2-oxoheptanedioate aldolase